MIHKAGPTVSRYGVLTEDLELLLGEGLRFCLGRASAAAPPGLPDAWRLLMPALAEDFTVVAADQRGIGLSDKPEDGYDTGTLAADLVALMGALGHQRFAVVGHDTGFAIGYTLAADHPDRVTRLALAEIPGPPGDVAP